MAKCVGVKILHYTLNACKYAVTTAEAERVPIAANHTQQRPEIDSYPVLGMRYQD